MAKPFDSGKGVMIYLGLILSTVATFWPVGRLGFVNLDDYAYVTQNPAVQQGFTLANICWAFTTFYASNWHPLTWLSHMLDCQLFALNAGGPHWVNLGFHTANVLLLFLVLRAMTRNVWRSAAVAALFALHPLRVESVAWISERKDVLSGFFFLLTLWAYAAYAGGANTSRWQSKRFYGLALLSFAFGLMSKPMLVTLPLILLLVDFWPLKRVSRLSFKTPETKRVLWEKIPFALLSVGSCVVTFYAQRAGNSVIPITRLPWNWRLENALLSCVAYLEKIFWPHHLAVFYPYGYTQAPLLEALLFAIVLLLFTLFCIRQFQRQPCWVMGWLWFLIMLVPVIGLVQVGAQSLADRYTYLPGIGLVLMLVWGLADWTQRSGVWRTVSVSGGAAVLVACALLTRHQLGFWRDSITLLTHAMDVAGESPLGHYYLANALRDAGRLDEAAAHYRAILRSLPDSEDIHYRLGYILLQQKKFGDSATEMREVLRMNSASANALMCLGYDLVMEQRFAEAERQFSAALTLRPGDSEIRKSLAEALQNGGLENIVTNLTVVLDRSPSPELYLRLAAIQITQRNFVGAMEKCREALRLDPDDADALNNLAWLLATCPDEHMRDGAEAVRCAERACQLTGYKQARTLTTLAVACASVGQFEKAGELAEHAQRLSSMGGQQDLVTRNQQFSNLFRHHKVYVEP